MDAQTQTITPDRIKLLDKVQKLRALALRSEGNVEEALAASKKMMELIEKHQIEEWELIVREKTPPNKMISVSSPVPDPRNHNVFMAGSLENLGSVKVSIATDLSWIKFWAMDLETATAMMNLWLFLVEVRENSLKRAYRTARKQGYDTQGFKTSYRVGFTTAVRHTISAHILERTAIGTMALATISTELTRQYEEVIKGKTVKVSSRQVTNSSYHQGYRKGEEATRSQL